MYCVLCGVREVPFYSLRRSVPTKINKETISPGLEVEYVLLLIKMNLDESPSRVGRP